MTAFLAAYRNESVKLLRRKKYIVFLIIGIFICTVMAVLGRIASDFIVRQAGFALPLTPSPMGMLPFFLQILLPLLIFMGVTDLITTEAADHTMKAMIVRPVARWKLYAGKLSAIMTYVIIYLACVFTVSAALHQLLGRGMGLETFLTTLSAYLLTIPPLIVLACFSAMLALMGRSASMTMLLLVGIYLAMNVLPFLVPNTSELLFTSYMSWHRLWIGALPRTSRLVHMITILVGYGVVFFMAGSLIFDRKEY